MSDPTLSSLPALLDELAAARAGRAELLGALWAMTPDERRAAYQRGELNLVQLRSCATHARHEMPATAICREGELHWIICRDPDYLGEFD